eukprot:3090562-Prymnesium_polylepis.1
MSRTYVIRAVHANIWPAGTRGVFWEFSRAAGGVPFRGRHRPPGLARDTHTALAKGLAFELRHGMRVLRA